MVLEGIKAVATDIDGTITNERRELNLNAVRAIRKLEKKGINVILVSSQSFLIVSDLAIYLGAKGPVIGETGAVVGWPRSPVFIARWKYDSQKITRIMLSLGFRASFSNPFRFSNLAFSRTEEAVATEEEIYNKLKEEGIVNVEVYDSGFGVHILPKGVNKGSGLLRAIKLLKINIDEVVVIGDGRNDIPMFKVAKHTYAPANADPLIKENASYVSEKKYGAAFVELANMLLEKK